MRKNVSNCLECGEKNGNRPVFSIDFFDYFCSFDCIYTREDRTWPIKGWKALDGVVLP